MSLEIKKKMLKLTHKNAKLKSQEILFFRSLDQQNPTKLDNTHIGEAVGKQAL